MRLSSIVIGALAVFLCGAEASKGYARQQVAVSTPTGQVSIESFESCTGTICPAVIILSGSKGFEALAYDEIGQTLRHAGLNAYLVHVLTKTDLDAIAAASGAHQRIAYANKRLPQWVEIVRNVVAHFKGQPDHNNRIGVLGISLGAQIALAAANGQTNINALVLVDGAFPNGYSKPVHFLPPLFLVWGSADQTFPLRIGQELQRTVQQLRQTVVLDVYQGGAHDFFLRLGDRNSGAARRSAAAFLKSQLSK